MSISPETLALAKKYTEESLLGAGALKGQDGITPHIGANGNWFIGDEDTGVSAGGSSGGSTGGGETEWKHETITLSEAVSSIEFNIPSAKRVLMYASLRVNDADNSLNTGGSNFRVKVNDHYAAHPSAIARQSARFFSFYDIEKVGAKTKVSASYFENNPTWSYGKNLQLNGWEETNKDATKTINSISIAVADTNYVIPADCFVEVYYR